MCVRGSACMCIPEILRYWVRKWPRAALKSQTNDTDSGNMAGEAPAATSPAGCNSSSSNNIRSSSNSNSKETSPDPDPVQQQLNSSVDSGIAVLEAETPTLRRRQRLSQCQRILQVLQRDHLTHQQLRDRLRWVWTQGEIYIHSTVLSPVFIYLLLLL